MLLPVSSTLWEQKFVWLAPSRNSPKASKIPRVLSYLEKEKIEKGKIESVVSSGKPRIISSHKCSKQQKIIIVRFLFKLNPLYTKLEQEIYWKEAEENLTGHLRNHHGAFCKIPKDPCGPSLGIINMKNHEIATFCALLKKRIHVQRCGLHGNEIFTLKFRYLSSLR